MKKSFFFFLSTGITGCVLVHPYALLSQQAVQPNIPINNSGSQDEAGILTDVSPVIHSYWGNYITQDNSLSAAKKGADDNTTLVLPPANDECTGAIALTYNGGDYTYTNVGATANGTDPIPGTWSTCTGGPSANIDNTVWFKFTVTGGPKNVTISSQGTSTSGNEWKAKYSVFSGSCGSLTQIGTTRAGGYGNYNSKSINIASLANGTYYIMTDGMCSYTGDYKIRVNDTPTGSPTLWYAAGTIPTLSGTITSYGQWGTYAATTEATMSCSGATGFSDWYQFTYSAASHKGIHVIDQHLQQSFIVALYDAAGTLVHCNDWGQAQPPSYTWDLSAQENIPMHMPNIPLQELGLTSGATYYVRVAWEAAVYNSSDFQKFYTITLGNLIPTADTYLNAVTLSVTALPTYSWLNGQTNRYAGESTPTEPEQGSLTTWNIDNSLLYKFNTGSATSVDVNLRNLAYWDLNGLNSTSAKGQIAVLTAPTGGTSLASNAAFSGSTFTLKNDGSNDPGVLTVSGLSTSTDYWILIDGAGTYEGTRITFDISVTTTTLPVELLSFNADCNGDKVSAEWETASELNSDYFTLEKSTDGTVFYPVATIPAAGNSSAIKKYSAEDVEPFSAASYYRLSETDFNGDKQIFDAVAVRGCGNDIISVFSSGTDVTLLINSKEDTNYSIFLCDAAGKIILDKKEFVAAGNNKTTFSLNAGNGIYVLKVFNDKNIRVQKLSIQ